MTACGHPECGLQNPSPPIEENGMLFHRCPVCSAYRIPDEQLHHETVPPDAPGSIGFVMKILFTMRMAWLRLCISGLTKRNARILDAGCGDGQFLEYLVRTGYVRAIGFEVDPKRLAHAQRRGTTVHSSLGSATQAIRRFDLIFLWHVYEHIMAPFPELRRLLEHISPGGTLVISVPNHNSIQNKLFGYYSSLTDYNRHVWYLDDRYFTWLASQIEGFEVRRLPEFNLEYEIFSWVDSLVSFILRRQNFIHRALKKKDGNLLTRTFGVLMAALFLPAAAVLSLLTFIQRDRSSALTYAIQKS